MAKHMKNKKVSKGQRISCKGLVKQSPKPQVGNTDNAIRAAFMVAPMTPTVRFSRLGAIIIKAAQAPVKRTAEQIKGWSTKLSFRTFKALQDQGVLS